MPMTVPCSGLTASDDKAEYRADASEPQRRPLTRQNAFKSGVQTKPPRVGHDKLL